MSNQGLRQASVRAVTETTGTVSGDWHSLWDDEEIAAGTFNERMLAWINGRLSASHTNINEAMFAFAENEGVGNWNELGTFDATIPE